MSNNILKCFVICNYFNYVNSSKEKNGTNLEETVNPTLKKSYNEWVSPRVNNSRRLTRMATTTRLGL